jgi:hypothetical protein
MRISFVCVCVVLFCHIWPVWLYQFFFLPHYVINGTIFGENLWNMKCVFDLLYKFVSDSNSEKNSGRYYKFTQIGQVKHS